MLLLSTTQKATAFIEYQLTFEKDVSLKKPFVLKLKKKKRNEKKSITQSIENVEICHGKMILVTGFYKNSELRT